MAGGSIEGAGASMVQGFCRSDDCAENQVSGESPHRLTWEYCPPGAILAIEGTLRNKPSPRVDCKWA